MPAAGPREAGGGPNPTKAASRASVAKVQRVHGRGLERAELGPFLFATKRFDRAHALAVLLMLNGLRVSEAPPNL